MQTGQIQTGPHGLRWFCVFTGGGRRSRYRAHNLAVAFGASRTRHWPSFRDVISTLAWLEGIRTRNSPSEHDCQRGLPDGCGRRVRPGPHCFTRHSCRRARRTFFSRSRAQRLMASFSRTVSTISCLASSSHTRMSSKTSDCIGESMISKVARGAQEYAS